MSVATSSRVFASLPKLAAFQKTLPLLRLSEELKNESTIQTLFTTLPDLSYKKLLKTLLTKVQFSPFSDEILSQCYFVLVAKLPNKDSSKFELMEDFIPNICAQIACQDAFSNALYTALKILEVLLKSESNFSTPSKALVFNIFPKVFSLIQTSSIQEFVQASI